MNSEDKFEIEKCKSLAYFAEKYMRIHLPDGSIEAPSQYMIDRCILYDQGHDFPLITGVQRHKQFTKIKKSWLERQK